VTGVASAAFVAFGVWFALARYKAQRPPVGRTSEDQQRASFDLVGGGVSEDQQGPSLELLDV
jgi:hypothetical protein